MLRETTLSNISSTVVMYYNPSMERLSVETAATIGNCQILSFKFLTDVSTSNIPC
jgi:hypothetical protein